MALTKDEIKEFKKEEKEAEDCFGFTFIADQISDAGDKEWAKNLYKKAEEKAEDVHEWLTESELKPKFHLIIVKLKKIFYCRQMIELVIQGA